MKTRLLYYFSITVYLLVFSFANLHAQNRPAGSWSKKLERQKSFIENKGQFTIPNSFGNPSEVLFAVDDGGTKIYFTKKGITYTFLEMWKKPKDEKELERERNEVILDAEAHERHEKEERKIKTKTDQVTMLWQNANPNVKIEASGVTDDYHSYYFKQANTQYKNVCYIRGFRKITYKDIYPNIDIDYVFHEKGGLEYSLTLHPGADPSQVKMVYDSHVDLNNAGEIRISTKFGDIIDHAPLTFYQNNNASVIASSFTKTGKTVSFQLANYDNTKTVVIDPWTQTPAFATNWDCVWECEKDGAGNVYLIGGVSPMQLIKYNAAGAIQWTYNTPYDTTAWLGTFATDNAGNSYVTQGSVAEIVRVSTAGAVVWNNTSPGGIFGSTEFWNITFNCDQTKLVIGGTGGFLPPLPYIYEMNMANGNVISSLQVTPGALIPTQEVRSIAPCGNGRYYFLTHDTIGYINQNFNACSTPNAAIYKATNTYSFGYKCENFRYDNTGIMAIKANTSFVYVNRGNRLDKRNLNTSAIISSVVIPGGGFAGGFGGNAVQNSGIDIDDCGNVYVGSKNAVIKFDANLNQLASYPTTYNVYDVHVTTGGNIIACGSTGTSATGSRSGTLEHINAGACATITLTCCDVNICQVPNQCSTNAPFNLQAATAGGTWSGPGITNATTGTFNPSTAGIGTHVVTYSLACGVGTTTINVTACGSVSLCINSGSLSVIGGASTYTWSSTTTSVSCAACPGGNCIPFICAGTTVPTWTASGTTVAAPSSTVFPIKVKDLGSGITFTFTTLAGIPPCTTTACPTLTMSVASQTNVNCFGASTGTANVSTSGGTGPYTYTWTPGALNGASQTGLAAGTYTIAIRDANSCAGTGTVIITQPTASLSAVISATTAAGCGSSTGGATVTASGGTAGYTYAWVPSGGTTAGVSNLATGNNTVTVTDSKGCTRTAVATISSSSGPTLSVVSQASVNCFGASTGSASVNPTGGTGPYTYTWTPGNLSGISQTGLAAGTYTVNVADASVCSGTTTLTITQPASALSAVISATTPASCGGSTTTAIFWTENFGVGCNQGALASVYTGTNGAWAVTNTGVNNPSASQWFVSATESGMGAGNCGDGCLGTGTTNKTLHVANVSTSPAAFLFCPTGDCGAAYDTGIGANNVAADKRAESPTINCTGQSNITLNFNYIEGGQTTIDDATLWYFDGATWTQIDNMPKTIVCGSGQGQWGTRTIVLPASANNNANVKVGYRWVNNDDGAGSDPSFAVDDITLSASSGAGGTGGATVTASGGTAGYTYAWTPSGGTTAGVSNLGAGSNTVVVTDSKGCTATAIANITSTGGPTLTIVSQASVTCFGASTGTTTVAGSGGTSPFTYTWSPGNLSGASQTSLAAGTYTINLMDANSCAGSGTLVITQPTSSLSAVISATTGAGCGASTGGATVTASGGTPSYTYAWVPSGGTTAGVSNLGAGNNTVVVIDANSCTVSAVANITTAGGPTLSVTSQTNVNCFGASTGSATINATGGTAPITYTWSPGNLSGTSQTGLAAGTYTINALDGNSCASSITVLITQPTASLTGVISNSTAPGCGSSTGSASVTASDGTPTYSYSWSPNGGTTPSVSNLSSGNSTVTITDSKGCTQSVVVSLASVSGPTLSVVSQTSVSCLGASTGAATVSAAGGTGPYTYTWSPGNLVGASQSSLAAGVYTVTVRDVNLCSGTGTISITQPTAGITGTITTTPTGCGNSIGSATVTASGGVPAYTYTWGPAPGSGTSISGLAVGSYSVIVADAQGCSVILNTSISTSGAGPALSISSQTNAVCASSTNAGASISATGTGPFTYSWTPVGGNSATSSGLSGGTYTVFVADAALCVSTITINITQPPAIVVTVTNTTASCGNYDGSATVITSGGTGSLTPLWSVNSNSATVTGLSAGTYSVLVTDATGCTASAITNVNSVGSLTINTSSDVTINDGESTQIIAFVPNGASVVWTPSTGLSCATCSATIASPTVTTEYCAYTTIGSCADTSCVLITVEVDCESKTDYSTPTAFSPNNDGINDEFCLKGWNECVTTFYIGIYNRWGEKIFESEDPGFCWDGTFKGNPLNSAVFVYYIKATVKDIGEVVRKGNITLVK
jgi:gliding motility-associated-like protein